MHLFLGATLDSYGPDDYLCVIIHPGFGSNSQTMWAIKKSDHPTNGMLAYLAGMFLAPAEDSELELYFGPTYSSLPIPG
jgi:hypothetical protein